VPFKSAPDGNSKRSKGFNSRHTFWRGTHQLKFPQAVALLRQWRGLPPILQEAAEFYRVQLHRHAEAVAYLYQRGIRSPEVIEYMRIGYAPGGCLRGWLMQLGHPLQSLQQAGLVTGAGYDAYIHRIVFPLDANLYGRSLSAGAPAHRFLPGAKGGLYSWEQVQQCPEVILVEGLFDYAALWQAGFHNVTCSMGNQLSLQQYRQLCDRPRTIYLAFEPTQTAVARKRRNPSPAGSESKPSSCGSYGCPMAMIQTASCFRMPVPISSNRCWRRRKDDLPRSFQALQQPCALPPTALSSSRPAVRSHGSTSTSMIKPFAVWPTRP
jgi:hypothetical protein